MDLGETGWGGMDWIDLAKGSFEHGKEPRGSKKKRLEIFQ
jgi:hypothetical protein